MKNILRLPLKLAALAAAGLLLQAGPIHAQTAPPSPVGTWDIVISGSQNGLAILTFNADFTFAGTEILRPTIKKTASPPEVDPRYPNGEPGRTPLPGTDTGDGTGTVTTSETNFLGSASLRGLWTYDANKKLIGLLDQISQVVEPTEVVTTNVLNGFVFYTTNIVLILKFQTNAVSFRATVVPGKKLTLNSYGPAGNNILRGVPAAPLADMSGSFYGTGKLSGVPFIEFLELAADGVFQNRYDIAGVGPGYTYSGRVIISKQKQIAFLSYTGGTTPLLTVYTGPFNLGTRQSGTLKGMDSDTRQPTYKLVHQ